MYTYSVFCVKSEVVRRYYYKTGILYRFLKEFKENRNYNYLQLQYKYITEPLTLNLISTYLDFSNVEISRDKRDKYLKIYWQDKQLTIYEDERHVEFTCTSLQDAEEFLFPVLRQLPLQFFVTRNSMKDYGWLSLNKNNELKPKQILYSFH